MGLGLTADDVHIFQTGATIEPKVRQILTKKSKALAKEENCDQRQDNDCDKRIAAEEPFDRRFCGQPMTAGGGVFRQDRSRGRRMGDSFHIIDDAERRRGRQRI